MNLFAGAFSRERKRAWILALALVAALTLTQVAWADHEGEPDWNITYHEISAGDGYEDAASAGAGQDFALLAESPELMAARSYYHTSAASGDLALLASNPELSAARNFVRAGAAGGSGIYLAANPELSAFRNYSDAVARSAMEGGFNLFAENPELRFSRDYCGC